MLAAGSVERHGGIDRGLAGLAAAGDLDQRDKVRRIERMAEQNAGRMGADVLELADHDGGGA